ncbi:uncharacterized protein N7483_008009 [Penicillium malachiteum]|uniref:uncharacterized protein n=1 Tax=Penicillium malachiteum TaxID=1324776 RepID=UPI0025467501|nr:uncharacterized protein N7483_008009 [Penicillium malachiteum]KAJ5726652.1 hypothetical protein N7483_008009 [Penicillium malachiteum]
MDEKEVVVLRSQDLDNEFRPDIVVGIDFGMTFTGVAYSSGPEWHPPKTIQRWPGKGPGELANKVPTCIEYEKGSNSVRNWGFACNYDDESTEIREYFKLHLAADYRGHYPGEPSRQEAQKWFSDYIHCIYQHVIFEFQKSVPQFESRQVEFIFSVPTTWKDVRMVEETRTLLKRAISAKQKNHHVSIGLTEAEAAAAYSAREHFTKGDTILVCDSGGGTTDVNVLKLMSSLGEPTRLEQMGQVEGLPIGSVFVDRHVHEILTKKLENAQDHLRLPPAETAWAMTTGRFQRFKCAFGSEVTLTPYLKLDVPNLASDFDLPEAGISDGQISIAWTDIQSVFDTKIDAMCGLIDEQIRHVSVKYPQDQIRYLILSGGFGSSPYLRTRLMERYAESEANPHYNAHSMAILVADEPQLVVVHGLVLDRVQQLKKGVVMFGSRCSPMSYGIICDKLFDPSKHSSEPSRFDARDKKKFAIGQIDWLVIQGTPIPYTGLKRPFQLKMNQGQENKPWKVQIVMSSLPSDRLPDSISQPGTNKVCDLDICIEDVDKKLKDRHWYNRNPAWWRTSFDVKVVIGPADLSFQLWSKDRRVRSNKHEPITVKWMPA